MKLNIVHDQFLMTLIIGTTLRVDDVLHNSAANIYMLFVEINIYTHKVYLKNTLIF
jgi:hypothetical protein